MRAILLPRAFPKGLFMSTIHTGSCHCGAVRYTAELDLTQPVVACNCSMCGRAGWLLSFIPATKFHLEAGEMIAINVRCLADVDPTQLEIKPFDGKSL